jgi:hypothetical protein
VEESHAQVPLGSAPVPFLVLRNGGSIAGRQGVVFIAADVHGGDSEVHFRGYWDPGDRREIEEMPETGCAADAIAWGLHRADDVRIRFDGCGYWWAGRGSMPESTEPDDEGFLGTVFPRH